MNFSRTISKKSILSILVVVCMVFAMIPGMTPAAYATETSGNCGAEGDNLTWSLAEDGTLTISGSVALTNRTNLLLIGRNRQATSTTGGASVKTADEPNVPTTYTYNTPDPIIQNGVTATVSFDKASPQEADTEITATVTLTGTAAAAGTHTINLNSTKASLTGTAQKITVTAGQTSFTAPNTYSFTIPAADVDDLTLEHTFEGMGAMRLGTAGIPRGDKVYFGRYTEGSITYDVPWIVLEDGKLSEATATTTATKTLPLMSEYMLGDSAFRDTSKGNGYYDGSTLQTAMKSIYDGFDSKEKTAVADTTLTGGSMHSSQGELSEQKLFPLSRTEAQSLTWGSSILQAKYITAPTGSAGWWLRLSYNDNSAFCVADDGYFGRYDFVNYHYGVRPAFNLDLSSVLFTSAAAGGKSSGTVGASALNPVSATTPTEWKLTLLDIDRNFDAATTAVNGDVLTITYSGATLGRNEYISAIIKDSSGNITRYGRLKNTTAAADASGTVNIDLSGVTIAATDTLYVFSEKYNGGTTDDTKLTDYASALIEIKPVPTYTVTLDKQGGTGGTDSVTATYDSAMPAVTPPTRQSYTFTGYFDAKTGGTKYYNDEGTSAKAWDKTAETTLYAQWTANSSGYVINPAETVTKPDGTTITTEKKLDGTVIITEKRPDGTTVKTKTTPDGKTTTEVTLPSGKGKTEIKIPVDLGEEDGRASVKITTGTGEKTVSAGYSNKEVSLNVYSDSTIEILDEFVPLSELDIPAGVEATTIKAKSILGKKSIKIIWTKSKGYKVDYFQIFRSVKRYSGYGVKPFFTTKTGTSKFYINTKSLKKGTTYYYKLRGVRVIDGKKYYTQWSTKAYRTFK